MRKARLLTALLPLVLAAAPGCVSSLEPDVAITPSPREDSRYYDALARATQSRKVIKDFETRWLMTATYLSPEFRGAFAERLARVYKEAPMQFEEASSKAGFFVSIDAPNRDRIDLTNPHHWTILFDDGQGPGIKPIVVKRLDDKERWRAFFDTVTEWTTEYLIVFDAPSVTPQSPDLVAQTPINVIFANADAQVKLSW